MRLKLEQLQARDLVDRGSIVDIQDPALVIYVGQEQLETRRIKHAGVNANFEESFVIELSDKDYKNGKIDIEVEALHKGAAGNRSVHIGKGKIALNEAITTVGTEMKFTIELTHQPPMFTAFKKGLVHMTGTIIDPSLQTAVAAAEDVTDVNAKALEKLSDETTNEFLKSLFGDIGELNEDIYCALAGRFLHTGRMYVTSHYICFYSKLFGREKKLRIPYEHIVKIELEQDPVLVLNKNVLIKTGSRDYKFWSFWDADQAFAAIDGYFDKYNKEHAQRKSSISIGAVHETDNIDDETDENSSSGTTSDGAALFTQNIEQVRRKTVVVKEMSLPVSVSEYAQLFIDDSAKHNYKIYHETVGDSQVELAKWNQEISQLSSGTDRELKFFKPVNLPGLASTRGVKLQRYCRFEEIGLTLSSSTRLESVPAADCFSVEDSVVVRSTGESTVSVEISFEVAFNKSTWMKSMIESPTNREMNKWLNDYFHHLQQCCKEFREGGGVIGGSNDAADEMDDDEIDAVLGNFKAKGYQHGTQEFSSVKLCRQKTFKNTPVKARDRPKDPDAQIGNSSNWLLGSLSLFPAAPRKPASTAAPSATKLASTTIPSKAAAEMEVVAATGSGRGVGMLFVVQIVVLCAFIYFLHAITVKVAAIEVHLATIAATAGANGSCTGAAASGRAIADDVAAMAENMVAGLATAFQQSTQHHSEALQQLSDALTQQHAASQEMMLQLVQTLANKAAP